MIARNERFQRGNARALIHSSSRIRAGKAPPPSLTYELNDVPGRERERGGRTRGARCFAKLIITTITSDS